MEITSMRLVNKIIKKILNYDKMILHHGNKLSIIIKTQGSGLNPKSSKQILELFENKDSII